MTSRLTAQCLLCAHWISPLDAGARETEPTQICAAFPPTSGGIPEKIWWNQFDHRESYPGDGGIRWEPAAEGIDFPDWAMDVP